MFLNLNNSLLLQLEHSSFQFKWLFPSLVSRRNELGSFQNFSTQNQTNNNNNRNLSILFYGSDNFSIESLHLLQTKLNENSKQQTNCKPLTKIKNLEVVTTSNNNQVYNYCKKADLPCHFFDKYTVPNNRFDLGVVSSFGRLIPKKSIESCSYGMLNVHGSLLPRWRGASPIQHAILYGDKVTGVTIMTVKPNRFDIGQIVRQRSIELLHRITAQQLRQLMAPVGAKLLWECIEQLDYSIETARDQPEEGVTLAPKLKESDGEIDWNRMDSWEIDRRYRAFVGSIGIYSQWIDGTQLRLFDVVDPDLVTRLQINNLSVRTGITWPMPGLIFYHSKRHLLCVQSANGTWSAFRTLMLKNRKRMSALGFYNTFIRPFSKAYKLQNGQKPIFVLGNFVQTTHILDSHQSSVDQVNDNFVDNVCHNRLHMVGVHNFGQFM